MRDGLGSPNAILERSASSSIEGYIERSFDDDDLDPPDAPPSPGDTRCSDEEEEDDGGEEEEEEEDDEEEVGEEEEFLVVEEGEDEEDAAVAADVDDVGVDRCFLRGNEGISSSKIAAGSSATFIVVPNCRFTSFATVLSKPSKSS